MFVSSHVDNFHVEKQSLGCWIFKRRQFPCRETIFGDVEKLYMETVSMLRNKFWDVGSLHGLQVMETVSMYRISIKCCKLASTNIHIHATPFTDTILNRCNVGAHTLAYIRYIYS